jgi:hypothetical protein
MDASVDNTLRLNRSCWFEHTPGYGIELCYVEHSPDPYYSDMDTTVDISREKALEIIQWLCEKFDLRESHGEVTP